MGEYNSSVINPLLQLASRFAREREFFRIPIKAKARICANGDIIEGEVENLSLNGARVRLDKQVKINSSVIISIFDNSTTSRTTFDIKAKVIWVMENGAGLQFA